MSQRAAIELDDALRKRVARLAEAEQRAPGELLQDAVREFVERAEKRQDFVKEAEASWAEFQQTGEAFSAEEIFAELDDWGKKNPLRRM